MIFEKFEIKCKKCGSNEVHIEDHSDRWDDGDGYIDVNEDFYLVCDKCGEHES